MTRPFVRLSPIADVGCDTGRPYDGLAGAVIRLALDDAKWGGTSARVWLLTTGRRWAEALGGDGYLERHMEDWR